MARRDSSRRPARSRRVIVVAVLIVLLFGSNLFAYFYTDVLWFQELGISSVLWKSLQTQFSVGAVTGVIVAAFVWLNLWIATRSSPVYALLTSENDPMGQFREGVSGRLRAIRLLIAAVIGLFTGLFASAGWQTFLLWANREPWGIEDPQFGRDISFYVFELPLFDRLLDQVWSAIFLVLVLTIATYYLFGAIKPQLGLRGMGAGALAHISVLLGLLALTKAGQYYLGQFHLNFSPRGVVTGASYTDVNAQLPALRLLAIISIVSAILFLINIRVRRLSLPLAAVGIWIAVAFLAGGVWPWWVQRFSVEPQEQQREAPYIARNLEATRTAFGLREDDISTQTFPASSDLSPEELEASSNLLENVRVWDPGVLQEAYQQLQAIRTYYRFADVDIDRYEIDGRTRQVLLSARELSLEDLPEASRNWANLHLQYTHGYGLVASLTNEQTSAGQPSFLVKDVPGTVEEGAESLQADEPPKIYFGEGFEPFDFSIVNSRQEEIDYPTEDGVARSSYTGEGGIQLSGIGRRLAFALRETDPNLILSSLITDESRILIYRNVRDRVQRAAPFLALDHDPYAAVVDGRLTWIIDAYTSTRWYPYSQRFPAASMIGTTGSGDLEAEINYIRNSVKVAVDASDGTMKLYVVDEEDPLIRVWRSVFPALFTEEDPSADLEAHFRYPEDLFKIQSQVYLTYHMEDPADFYSKEDEWAIPQSGDPTTTTTTGATPTTTVGSDVDPSYLLISLPDETEEEFVLARPFTPRARNNMISLMLARSDPEHYGELRILQFPRQVTVLGPVQVNNLINQDVEVSQTLTLLSQEGSEVRFGSLLSLPIQDSILYVQPLFITAENEGIPELKRVILVFGEEVVMEESFEEALATLFELDDAPDEPAPRPTLPGDPEPEPEPEPPTDGGLQDLIRQAAELYERAQEALSEGDFESYGRLIERLGRLLQNAR